MNLMEILALIVGFAAILVGAAALIYPARASMGYGIKADSSSAQIFIQAMGARDLFIGAVFILLSFAHDDFNLGRIAICTAGVSGVDAFLTYRNGAKRAAALHAGATLAAIVYGLIILCVWNDRIL